MKRKNRTRFILLGLIAKEPMSGYDIKKFIDQGVNYFWSESYGQIYPMLRELEKEGLASVSIEENEGKPDRNVYNITESGREQLKQWLNEPNEEQPARYEFLLRLYFGKEIGPSRTMEHLEKFREENNVKLGIFREIENHLIHVCTRHPEKIYSLLTVRFGITECESRIEWASQALKELEYHDQNIMKGVNK